MILNDVTKCQISLVLGDIFANEQRLYSNATWQCAYPIR